MAAQFELLEVLGRGGMGVVWRARDAAGNVVALKLLHDLYLHDPDYLARFEREVEVARRIDSPNVVRVLGYGRREGVPYMAMEYVPGESLRERLQREKRLPWPEAKRIAAGLLRALEAAHAAGVIHRDVKPSNVMLAPDGGVKLADFGIARAMDLTRLTGGATMLGTPAYMSPEGEASPASDLYAVGCVLYEMLAGSPPFVGDTMQQVILRHVRDAPDLAKAPPEARHILGWLLAKEPRERPANAGVALAALLGTAAGPKGKAGAAAPARRRSGPPLVLALVAAIVVFSATATLVWSLFAAGGGGDVEAGGETPSGVLTRVAGLTPIDTPTVARTAVLPTATQVAEDEPQTLRDDFQDPLLGLMTTGSSGDRTWGYAKGYYVIKQDSPRDAPVGALSKYRYDEVDLAVTVEAVTGTNQWIGMSCNNKYPDPGGYYFWIDPARGRILLGVAGEVAGWNLIDWQPYPGINSSGPNVMHLACGDASITLGVNDGPRITRQDATWPGGGRFGFGWGTVASVLAPAGSVRYSNLEVTVRSSVSPGPGSSATPATSPTVTTPAVTKTSLASTPTPVPATRTPTPVPPTATPTPSIPMEGWTLSWACTYQGQPTIGREWAVSVYYSGPASATVRVTDASGRRWWGYSVPPRQDSYRIHFWPGDGHLSATEVVLLWPTGFPETVLRTITIPAGSCELGSPTPTRSAN